jgi:ankyrin repeat protein
MDGIGRELLEAAKSTDETAIRRLLALGVDVNSKAGGATALLRSAQIDNLALCQLLLEAGADPNLPDSNGRTPLYWANAPELVALLLSHGASVKAEHPLDGEISLHAAAGHGQSDRLKLLLGGDGIEMINTVASQLGTPLCSAAMRGSLAAATVLIQFHADLDATDSETATPTPLQYALYEGYVDVARLLLEAGADPDIHHGMTQPAAHLAKKQGCFEELRPYLVKL